MITLTQVALQRATGCTPSRAALFLPFLIWTMKNYDINTPKRAAGFLSQISHESNRLETLEENLNYSVDALLKMFGRHRISEQDARRLGRTATRPADQQGIANCIYGGPWGLANLGNSQPGDGWRYRGQGLKQLTGRANAAACGKALGEDFIKAPERLLLPVNAALSAGWFWSTHGCTALADAGNIPALTKAINGGDNGLKERVALYGQALQVLA